MDTMISNLNQQKRAIGQGRENSKTSMLLNEQDNNGTYRQIVSEKNRTQNYADRLL